MAQQGGNSRNEQSGGSRANRELRVQRGGRASGRPAMVQKRKVSHKGWTAKKRAAFLDVLKGSCNVREAARIVAMSEGSAYDLRRRDPAFAAEWKEALEQGYAELEMLLLRQSIYGAEMVEIVDDGKNDGGVKTKKVHSYPHAIALRLLLAHRETVNEYRNERGIDRPGSENVRAEIQDRLAEIRARKQARNSDFQGDNSNSGPPPHGDMAHDLMAAPDSGGRQTIPDDDAV